MEDRATRAAPLERLLMHHRRKRIVGLANRQLRRIRVIGRIGGAGLQDQWEALAVLTREPIGRPLCGRGLQVVEVTGFLLKHHDARVDVIEQAQAKFDAGGRGNIFTVGGEVPDALVEAIDPDGAEMIPQGAQTALGEGIQTRWRRHRSHRHGNREDPRP